MPGEGPRAEDVAGAGPVRERGDGPREFHGLDDDEARRGQNEENEKAR